MAIALKQKTQYKSRPQWVIISSFVKDVLSMVFLMLSPFIRNIGVENKIMKLAY